MPSLNFKPAFVKSVLAATALLVGSGAAFGQATVNLTAQSTATTLPDGSSVPMWGLFCNGAATGASCAGLSPANPTAVSTGPWSPPVITVPVAASGATSLTINLTNSLPAGVPTSLTIVGQLGGGLGTPGSTTPSPDHTNAQPLTWPIAGDAPGAGLTGVAPAPAQGARVQSFGVEAASGGSPAVLTWNNLKPGTYLLESGTHPSIQGPMGLYGIVVVTTAATAGGAGTAYGTVGAATAVTYNSDVALLFSEIDPVQNTAVNLAANTAGFAETNVWAGPSAATTTTPSVIVCRTVAGAAAPAGACYPPAVNYTPLYYLINGVAFDKTNPGNSLFASSVGTSASPLLSGSTVLVRLVNAGLRMHVPAIVGSQTSTTVGTTTTTGAGFSLIAEDGNQLPGIPRVQSEVFMAAGKTNDVMINVPTGTTPLPIFDRELSLSANAIARDAGMLAYIGVNGATLPGSGAFANNAAQANPDTYGCATAPCALPGVVSGQTLVISDPAKGVIANDINVSGVTLLTAPTAGTVTLNRDGTFTYVPAGTFTSDSFTYCANGTVTAGVCSSPATATVMLNAAPLEAASGITCTGPIAYTSTVSTYIAIRTPGVLATCKDAGGYPLKVDPASVTTAGVIVDADGGFNATSSGAGTVTFSFQPVNSQGTHGATQTVSLTFPVGNGPTVTVLDGKDVLASRTNPAITPTVISDYRWIIEEDRTFYVDPNCTTNPPAAGCPGATTAGVGTTGIVPTFGTNFHTSYMPVVATGCTGPLSCEGGQTIFNVATGTHDPAVCDVGNGVCRPDPHVDPGTGLGSGFAQTMPSLAHLDPTKRYYLTIFPGDAGNPFSNGNLSDDCTNGSAAASNPGACGHGMGGTPLRCTITPPATACAFNPVTVLTQPDPYPPSKLSVFVFEDDFPLNGEHDGGGGLDVLSQIEPGLGNFNITLFDDAGGTGDATGQMTYDMFNQPLVNSLAGSIDPATGLDACPVTAISRIGAGDPTQTGITGTIVVCPKFESDGTTLSPLAGQAVVANLMPGRYGVVATPGADRIARGEEWLQTNTLDGQKAHDSFLRIGEPSFFQEFGPAGYHVSIGFANPQIINSRLAAVCNGTDPAITGKCTPGNTVTGLVTTERMSRTPDERLYSSGDNSSFAFTQCYVSFGDADGEDFAFTKCAGDGSFTLSGLPDGDWRITVFDQWNDMLVDGLSTPVRLGAASNASCPGSQSNSGTCDVGDIAMNQWQANIYTNTFFDANGNGVRDSNEAGLTLVSTNIRFRDGSYSNFNNTDLNGNAGFNEVFPLFSWYVIETDSTRYKNTGIHVVYDSGGPADGTLTTCGGSVPGAGYPPCGNSNIAGHLANTAETVPVPPALHVPGAYYCADADCSAAPAPLNVTSVATAGPGGSSGRVDPPWVDAEGWQGFSGQNSFLEFGKAPFQAGENGGIHGEVIYASTRPFDDPQLLIHTSWTPDVPGVTINLYQVGTAPDGSQSLTLVDTTKTSSWDDWAQGFRSDGVPNMNCPGQSSADVFYFTLYNQPNYLDVYNNGGTPAHTIPNNSQYKCYDGMHNWNQLQPAYYDGAYKFPSIAGRNPVTGKPVGGTNTNVAGTNCTVCVANPTDGTPMLPMGKYVVEMIVPPGYELVKEEDKNILIGDNYIAPATVQFPGLGGAIYILPDQASLSAVYNANQPGSVSGYNATNAQNPTQSFGRMSSLSSHEGDTGSVESFWPCVGTTRIVPDYISLFPQSAEVAPFAGARRNLCDRKLVTLDDQTSVLAKFWVFTSAHVAAHFTGVITDDYTSEFDPFSPQFGEKFSPANLPVALKDWTGQEISRVYADQWGTYNGLTYSSWEVNPPNPTGYAPTMMVTCMNDPGTGPTPDPLFNPQYSQFCYEIPFMPGQTQYMDTPVVPTSAFAGAGYNNPDCAYPDGTPAVKEVDGDGIGPWVSAAGHTLTIDALGDQMVPNYAYTGPSATAAPYNQKTVLRHYGFGNQTSTVSGGAAGSVTIGGVPATVSSWSDSRIVVTVPSGVPACDVQQLGVYGGSAAQCGELVITAATAASGGMVTGVSVTPPPAGNRGGTYTGNPPTAPTVTFTGGGGSGATATANLGPATGSVASVTVNNGGSGYTANFNVTFSGGGGTGAHGTAVVRRHVTGVTLTTNASHVYTSRPNVSFSAAGAGGANAIATAVMSNEPAGTGTVTGINISSPGNYPLTGTITVTFSGGGATTTNRASGTATTTGFVLSVTMTGAANSGGSGYSSAPTPVFTAGSGTGAAGTATLSARTATVVSVTVTNGGMGYTSAPTVTFSGSTATRAVGTASVNPYALFSGRQSIDSVTVTIGGKSPTHVPATGSIQSAIDKAQPGDLIIIDPTCVTTATGLAAGCSNTAINAANPTQTSSQAAHTELLIMWKPVRLQGVGAASSVINANTHPAGKLDAWRRQVNCLFGLAINGQPMSDGNPFDPSGVYSCKDGTGNFTGTATTLTGFHAYVPGGALNNPQVDRLPLEAVVGWDASQNGNMAELLQEPSLMGALEGAGITVLAKGMLFPVGSDPFQTTASAVEGGSLPDGTILLDGSNDAAHGCGGSNPFSSNFYCNPSSIDGLGIQNGSQGGGGVFVHGWGHNLQIANNRIVNNAGTLSGGINLGQGEFPPSYTQGGTNAPPGSCEDSPVAGAVLPYCQNVNVNMHHNYIAQNSSTGDELFSATPAGAGGVSICTGSDYYEFNYNWVCGNLSSGDGGGIGHLGLSYYGDIEHNTILFNQSTNPTIPANGGGIIVMGTPDADLTCSGTIVDADCTLPGTPAAIVAAGGTPSDGVGPGLVINANLIMGNAAEAGTGGGIAFQAVNGTDMVTFPTDPGQWNLVTVTNNIIVDNVSGWDGGGISLRDSPNVNIVNNTIAFNASTASSGVLFNTIGGPLASQQGPTCTANCGATSHPQIAGVVAIPHSAVLAANLSSETVCPPGHFQIAGGSGATNGSCTKVSYPKLENNIIYNNSSYYIGVGALSAQFQQSVVSLYNAFTGTAAANQTSTGSCPAGASYWDLGVRGDTAPGNHASTVTLTASDSVLSPGFSALGGGNSTASPSFVRQYCDGSRVPPEAVCRSVSGAVIPCGWQVPPGISDATVPNPVFSLTPAATVDEGNNWVNIAWGPLSMTNPTAVAGTNGNYGGGLPLGNYAITTGSSAAGRVTGANFTDAPEYDFFDNPRKPGGSTDAGAVRLAGTPGHSEFTVSPALVDFGFVPHNSPTTVDQDIVVYNSDIVPLTGINASFNCAGVANCNLPSYSLAADVGPNRCVIGGTLGAGQSCVLNVVFNPTSSSQAPRNANLVVTAGGLSQTVSLTGHDTIATATVSAISPALTAAPANTAAVTGTITITNTSNLCLAAPCPGGSSVDAGPIIPVTITLMRLTGSGTFALGGSCAVGTAINPGVPAQGGGSAVPNGTCTITVTYTPPATGPLGGSARLNVTGYGTANTGLIVNRVINAN